MEIGIALPTMATGFTRATFEDWCRGIDEGPYSSISSGERITFHNPELLVTTTAAAALTERVQVVTNITVLPLHRPAMLAKQLATLDVLAAGRLVVGVGVGGREQDYRALGVPFEGRHRTLDSAVAELRRLWAGESAYDGGQPVGPAPCTPGGPPLWAAAMGPKSMARAARWADGVTGFSIGADRDEIARGNQLALDAWEAEGRSERPRLVSGTFYLLGGADADAELQRFARAYLAVFGDRAADALSRTVELSSPARLLDTLAAAEAAGCDEFILVPGTVDPGCLERTTAALAG
ncbi:MAG TPA: LLM class flavin-dependent oxidoreductase [Acidimicrobiales bacterium]|nr:LLM class flavin-dependent oxidoreductase [Acidimicrobiales bacterium]